MTVEDGSQRRSPLDIMIEIEASLYPPLPTPPEDASWLNKNESDLTEFDRKARWDFMVNNQRIIANQPWIDPEPNHPRYGEYMDAKRKYESWFRLTPKDLLTEFDI